MSAYWRDKGKLSPAMSVMLQMCKNLPSEIDFNYKEVFEMKTPILFVAYKRPMVAMKAFMQIMSARPERLYIAFDGPANETEISECQATRDMILNSINWKCQVSVMANEKNEGCKETITNAMAWTLSQEEKCIVIEDDAIMSEDNLKFIEALLEYYKDEKRIWWVNSANLLTRFDCGHPYFFSALAHAWCYATWADRFNNISFDLPDDLSFIDETWSHLPEAAAFWKGFIDILLCDGFAYRHIWPVYIMFSIWKNNGLCLTPSYNLVYNIGFGPEATVTKTRPSKYPIDAISLPSKYIDHPQEIERNLQYENQVFSARHELLLF